MISIKELSWGSEGRRAEKTKISRCTRPFSCALFILILFILNGWVFVYEVKGCGFKSRCSLLRKVYLNHINFCTPFVSAQHECSKIDSVRNKPFLTNLGRRKLMVCKFLKHRFSPEFDGILWYFSRPYFYPIQISVTNLEKENFTENCQVVLVSQVKSSKHKNLSVGSLTTENNTLKICTLQPHGFLVVWC